MDRAYESGSSESAPLAPETPSIGYPTAGTPGAGTPATKPGPWWYHMVTEEVRNVILSAGLTPDHEDLSQLSAAIQSLIDIRRLPVGSVVYVAKSSAPTGYLKANGAVISRTAYAALFAEIGTTFGAGDGATTFNVPDLRGEFVRGYDDGRGIDSGRTLGSWQKGSLAAVDTGTTASSAIAVYGVRSPSGSNPTGSTGVAQSAVGLDAISAGDYPSASLSGLDSALSIADIQAGGLGGTSGSARPRNVALLACIKY